MAKKILIVDDEKDFVQTLSFRLKAENFDVITAHDGDSGLEKAKKKSPDLIILDIMMPNMDGYMVCKMLKLEETLKKIPVIMLTVQPSELDEGASRDVGADAYMTKPFNPQALINKIRKLLGEGGR